MGTEGAWDAWKREGRGVRRKKRDRHGGTDVRGKEEGKRDGGEGEGRILA